jgi:small subunit ribosomal protein S6
MTQMYEGMFLLENQVVREDWKKAKSVVTDTLEKHGAKVISARRWDERKLAYPIRRHRRATYCLAFYEMGHEGIVTLRRDLELNESVLRYLILSREKLPEGEAELAAAEDAAGFTVPAPPSDDAPDSGGGFGRRREEGTEGDPEIAEVTDIPGEEGAESRTGGARGPRAEAVAPAMEE